MAWEWVAPVATATASTAVGVAGIFFTWLSGKQGRDHAETISGQQFAHARLLAKEARDQQRLESAYVALLEMAERAGQWAQLVLPMMDTNPPQPVPPLPSLDEQAHAEAFVRAFGSNDVRERMDKWEAVLRQVVSTVEQIQWEEADPRRASERSPRLTLQQLRPQERAARQTLAEQVSAELRPEPSVQRPACAAEVHAEPVQD
ncbi:MAG TPA: hypothetical protein VME67_02880 [Mycobacterium sp.]|nr:hypothetical protein [Mycobacterium sp.]HTX93863.1 hypothetical protein [Mycobacterium sp.]